MYDMKTRCPQIQIGARMFCKIIAEAAAAGVFYPWAVQYSEESISTCVWLYLGKREYWLLDHTCRAGKSRASFPYCSVERGTVCFMFFFEEGCSLMMTKDSASWRPANDDKQVTTECDITELEPEKWGPALRNRLEGQAPVFKDYL